MTKILCTYKTAIGSKILPRVSFEVTTSKQTKCTLTYAKIGKSPIAEQLLSLLKMSLRKMCIFGRQHQKITTFLTKKPPSRSLIWEYVIFRKPLSRFKNMLNPNLHKKKRFGGRNSVPQFLCMVGVVPSYSNNFPSQLTIYRHLAWSAKFLSTATTVT